MTENSQLPKSLRDHISPPQVLREVLHSSELIFEREHGACPFLAIRLEGDLVSLLGGLKATGGTAQRAYAKPMRSLGFDTDLASSIDAPTPDASTTSNVEQALHEHLAQGPHYLLPLQKRTDVDAPFMDRISVGRAPNRDIVLRHASVSKFHAWFETDASGAFRLLDSGSKNGTRVNGERLLARETQRIEPGDTIVFGSVQTIVCDARTLWRVLWRG